MSAPPPPPPDLGVTEVVRDLDVVGLGVEARLAAFEDLTYAPDTC